MHLLHVRLYNFEHALSQGGVTLAGKSLAHLLTASEDSDTIGTLHDPEVFRVASYVQQILQSVPQQKRSKMSHSLAVEDVSKMVGLPVSSVKRAIRTISARDTSELDV